MRVERYITYSKCRNFRANELQSAVNNNLLGRQDGARLLQTPALFVDRDKLHWNLQRMQKLCDSHNLELRPHTKTHKSVTIARMQVECGAIGICCAKLGEAEVMSSGGIESILVTSPLVTESGIRRALALTRTTKELLLVMDNPKCAEMANRIAGDAGLQLDVLLDVDAGMHRTGVEIGEPAIQFASALANQFDALNLRGLQYYAGHLMHKKNYNERRTLYLKATDRLRTFIGVMRERGVSCEVASGGGTGSYEFDCESNAMTELQAGSYAFMDRQYLAIDDSQGNPLEFQPSLFVQSTVVSSNHPRMVTTDAGLKAFATDDDVPLIVEGAPPQSRYGFMGDEHGAIRWESEKHALEVGSCVRMIVPHCDPTINLYDVMHVVEEDTLVDLWRVDARGCSY